MMRSLDDAAWLQALETTDTTRPGVYLQLSHGRSDPKQEMNDWGFDGPTFGPLKYVHFVYGEISTIAALDGEDRHVNHNDSPLVSYGDMLRYKGNYYGDFSLSYRGDKP